MKSNQVQVLVAVGDVARSAAMAQLLINAGGAVSMARTSERVDESSPVLEPSPGTGPCLLVLEVNGELDTLRHLQTSYPNLAIAALLVHPDSRRIAAVNRLGVKEIWKWPFDSASATERAASLLERLRIEGADPRVRKRNDTGDAVKGDGSVIRFPSRFAEKNVPREDDGREVLSPPLMVGDNPRMAEIRETIEKVSGTDVTVLIRGESGVGKEIVARQLFEHSRRCRKPLIKVNCAAIPHDLLESELFGYEVGAFTGAIRSKPGKFELAHGGTLFLDEIAEMHPSLQAKLLHVLQDGKFSRLGAKGDVAVDVRVICATNKPLEERVREGLFREDLLYRINVVTLYLPPLRERSDEIPILADYLLRKFSMQYGRPFQPFGHAVSARMLEYDWPGNIRELENMCKRFVLVGSETQILRELSNRRTVRIVPVPADISRTPASRASGDSATRSAASRGLSLLEIGRRAALKAERQAILEALESTHWNRREASRRLQVSYKALLNKIKQMGLDVQPGEGVAAGEIRKTDGE
jgi:DNA-binding NtrC family response regulator